MTVQRRGMLRAMRALWMAGALAGLCALSGCSTLGYYWQSASGHLSLMHAARPVDAWLQDPATPDPIKARLALAQQMRRFAATELHLPDNPSYQRYADLQRPAAVWNVVAAPELSLQLHQWCFPVAGCVGYKGYFDRTAAEAEAAQLRAQGLEVSVQPVPAYSTLGWSNWAGGDPLLNTFIHYPEGALARLIFHELAHQRVYAAGDMRFNESFATAVEQLGGARWLASHGSPATQAADALAQTRRLQFRALTLDLQQTLRRIYKESGADEAHEAASHVHESRHQRSDAPAATPAQTEAMRSLKSAALKDFARRYAGLKAGWDGYAGFDRWADKVNNATLGAMSAYDALVPGFEALFEKSDRDWPRFYAAVQQLAKLPKAARHEALRVAR
jgi:predicted aminopeptidase